MLWKCKGQRDWWERLALTWWTPGADVGTLSVPLLVCPGTEPALDKPRLSLVLPSPPLTNL